MSKLDRRTILNVVFALATFGVLQSTVQLLVQIITAFVTDGARVWSELWAGNSTILANIIVVTVVSAIGICLFAVAMFSQKLSARNLVVGICFVLVALIILFGLSLRDDEMTFSFMSIPPIIQFGIMLGIYCYQYRQPLQPLSSDASHQHTEED